MKLLLDENVPRSVFDFLKENHFDILWIRESNRGISDEAVIQLAVKDSRIIITYDKDFGELVFRHFIKVKGVVLIRILDENVAKEKLLELLRSHKTTLADYFMVLTEKHIRRRKIGMFK
ncbi:DUF5615 family PIN-like protein [bacterium]|nr:DUF5615 family PIN-like protein [bacterium]